MLKRKAETPTKSPFTVLDPFFCIIWLLSRDLFFKNIYSLEKSIKTYNSYIHAFFPEYKLILKFNRKIFKEIVQDYSFEVAFVAASKTKAKKGKAKKKK